MMPDLQRVRSGLLGGTGVAYLGYAYTLEVGVTSGGGLLRLLRCPSQMLAGIECPLCGMTRSWHATMNLDWEAAFDFHLVAPVLLPVAMLVTGLHLVHFAGTPPRLAASISRRLPWLDSIRA